MSILSSSYFSHYENSYYWSTCRSFSKVLPPLSCTSTFPLNQPFLPAPLSRSRILSLSPPPIPPIFSGDRLKSYTTDDPTHSASVEYITTRAAAHLEKSLASLPPETHVLCGSRTRTKGNKGEGRASPAGENKTNFFDLIES